MPSRPPKDLLGEDDDRERSAEQRDIERVRRARNEPEPPDDDDDDEDEIEVGGDDDDDDEVEPEPTPRQKKRQERGAALFQKEKERADRLEAALSQNNQILQHALQQRQAPTQQPTPPKDEELERLNAEADTLEKQQLGLQARFSQAYARKAQQAELDAMQSEGFKLRRQIADNDFKRNARANQPQQPQGMLPQHVDAIVVQRQAMSEFGDVLSRQDAALFYRGEVQKLVALGKPDDWDTHRAAAAAARAQFRMPPRGGAPAPTAGQKRRLVGHGSGPAPRSGGEKRTTITMTKDFKRMADEAYPQIKEPKKRYQKWANGPGARLIAAGKI